MGKKQNHINYTGELVRSVLKAVPVAALCGREHTFSREDFDGKDRPVCAECVSEMSRLSSGGPTTLLEPASWTETLERHMLSLLEPEPTTFTAVFRDGQLSKWRADR